MQIMTKINNFEEIFFKSSIIFHVFAHRQRRTVIHNCPAFCFCTTHILIHTRGKLPYTHPHPSPGHEKTAHAVIHTPHAPSVYRTGVRPKHITSRRLPL